MTLATALPAAFRTALIANAPLAALLASYKGQPAVFTRRPVPSDAKYPLVIVPSENAASSDQDGLRSKRPVLQRDVLVYGDNLDSLRQVDEAAELIFLQFHRQKWSLQIEGFRVIDIVARRPLQAPASDAKKVGRVVPMTLRLQDLAG